MEKLTNMVLMLCFILSGAFCYAGGVARTEKTKGEGSILIKKTAQHGEHRRAANLHHSHLFGNWRTLHHSLDSANGYAEGDFEHILTSID